MAPTRPSSYKHLVITSSPRGVIGEAGSPARVSSRKPSSEILNSAEFRVDNFPSLRFFPVMSLKMGGNDKKTKGRKKRKNDNHSTANIAELNFLKS